MTNQIITYGERNLTLEQLRDWWDKFVPEYTHWEKRSPEATSYCLVWDRSIQPYPQALLRFNDEYAVMRLHRVALTLKLGRYIRQDKVASHLCHNKDCINPGHLVEESQGDNMRRKSERVL